MFYNPKVISLITIILQEVSSENDPGSLFMVVGNIFRVVFNLSTSFQYTWSLKPGYRYRRRRYFPFDVE